MATILAVETSCDETAIALLKNGKLVASEIASQIAEHEKYGGVVPEVASRNHLLHAQRLLDRALTTSGVALAEVDAFAATTGPGLATSLMIGASLAKGLAIALNKPYLAINHLEGHLLSPFFGEGAIPPNVSLVVSGGHTLTVHLRGVMDYEIVGRTVDDAAGEAFDKVAKMLGLSYPGGPEIEKAAAGGDPARFELPRSMPGSPNFSFSGLKTAVRYLLPTLQGDYLADLCASFQQAVIDVLVAKTIAAAGAKKVRVVTLSGGVSCNRALQNAMRQACTEKALAFKVAEPRLSTDNAGMIAFVAGHHLARGVSSDVSEEIDPNRSLVRGAVS
jgi:tRNA N6-adenosine threonylcarbamoyltransferase